MARQRIGATGMPQNGEILDALQTRIQGALKRKLTEKDKDLYEIFEVFVIYLKSDHERVGRMWTWFVPFSFLAVAVALAIIGTLVKLWLS